MWPDNVLQQWDGKKMELQMISWIYIKMWGMRSRSWLRHCATSCKVAGSIPDGVIGIFHWYNPSGRTMALELTQPLTEWVPGTFPRG